MGRPKLPGGSGKARWVFYLDAAVSEWLASIPQGQRGRKVNTILRGVVDAQSSGSTRGPSGSTS